MIDTEHTPGPWLNWETLEWLHEPQRLLTNPLNARAMGAAPEMLEALLEFISMFSPPPGSIGDEVVQKAKAAITKATGSRSHKR